MTLGLADHLPELRKANKAVMAEFFGVSVATVDNWQRRGCPAVQRGSRGVPWVYDLLEVARWRFAPQQGPGQGGDEEADPDTLSPKERLDWYRGEETKRKLQVADGTLVPADEHERALADVVKVAISWAETLPDVLERDAGLSPQQIERVQLAVDRVREELHASLAGEGDV